MASLALRGVLAFGCASLAVAQTADSCDEPVSLLQSDLQSLQRASRKALSTGKDDACQCLNWKQTYASNQAECGQGFEFMIGPQQALRNKSAEDWLADAQQQEWRGGARHDRNFACWGFYEIFDDNKCARATEDISDTEWYGKSWCYVSSACSSAMKINSSQVSVKFCEEGTDSLLSDMTPTELADYGKRMEFAMPNYFVRVSYPVDRSINWRYSDEYEAEISKLKASGKPVVVEEITGPNQGEMVIFGNEVIRFANAHGNEWLL